MVYRFEPFEMDDREFRLLREGVPVALEPKALRLLLYLVQNRNRLVRKQELLDHVWPDAIVTENALTRAIVLLRKALHDDSHVPLFIETVPTAGYRFIAQVTTAEESVPSSGTTNLQAALISPPQHNGSPRRWILAGLALVLAAILTTVFLWVRHNKKILTEKDTIVLADFANSTGDPVFDGTLRQGMEVQLEQSPFLSLVTDERIHQVLRLMGQPADAQLTPTIAREICERTASAAVLDGSIAPLGHQYVLGLRATDCISGKVLAEEQVQAARKEDVLNALDQIAGKLRTRLGESLTTVEKYDTPLVDATTSSLEALRAYSLGRKKNVEGQPSVALPFFAQAVELDPNFAMAYASMASFYDNDRQQPERSTEYMLKAYQLRDRVSDRERFPIEAQYYQLATGEQEKAITAYEVWQQTYPRDFAPYNRLDVLYRRLGNREKALEEARETLRLAPNSATSYTNLAADYVNLNRLDEAEAVYRLAEERKAVLETLPRSRYLLAFLRGDRAQMAQLASSVTGKPGVEHGMLFAQANTAAWYGRLKESHALTQRAMALAERYDAKETAAGYGASEALFAVEMGGPEQASADAAAAMKLAASRDVQRTVALTLARAGDIAAAEKSAAELDKAFPVDTFVQRYWLPMIRAAVSIQRKDPAHAIELLQAGSDIELGDPRLLLVYLRGEAYLMLHDGNRAAAEFQKFIDNRGLVRNFPWGPLARLGLARAYAMQGDTTRAKAWYQEFLAIWKDADPDLPLLKQAKAEYAKLQ
jgi:DNA-binding winged helix-turn-helix (wHTH) protein/tetratricopeptide (TPR) repeat protein